MKPNVWVYIFEGFAEFEIAPVSSLLQIYCNLKTFATRKAPINSESGWTVVPDFSLDELNPAEVDAIIIPGGDMAPNVNQGELFSFVENVFRRGGLVASICSGAFILNESGLLQETPYTVTMTKDQRDFLKFDQSYFIYQPIVQTKNVITAQGHSSFSFAIAVAEALELPLTEQQRQFYLGRENLIMLEDVKSGS